MAAAREQPAAPSQHAFSFLRPRAREGLVVASRRATLKAGLAGLAGLSVADLLRRRADAATNGRTLDDRRAVILLWMAGGPSHIDTWDPKPDAPREIRGPFATIPTRLPGIRLSEYYPKQAAMLDRLTIIRSVDCRGSNHQPNTVMQTGNRDAEPRVNPRGDLYPAIGSISAARRGASARGMPPYVALNVRDRTHFAWAGYLGKQHDPFVGDDVGRLLVPAPGSSLARIETRCKLRESLDRLRRDVDASGAMDALDRFEAQAVELVAGGRARRAFDLADESPRTVERYGAHDWCEKALLARRLVEAGARFVTLDLSNHSASGTWDTHGDNIPPYGGIWNGLRPLLPIFDHLFTTLVDDLAERGLIDDVLVIAMGEFGRSPRLGTQESTDGRDHWPIVMSLALAGGRLRHGQVIGASDRHGGSISERPVTPADLAATIYHHLGVPLDATYTDFRGRPRAIVEAGGAPLAELG